MKRLSKFALVAAAVLTLGAAASRADSGIFGVGVVLSSNIGGVPAFDLFELTLLGDGRHAPDTSGGGSSLGAPTLVNTDDGLGNSTWAVNSNGPSLGTFDITNGDTLKLNGGEMLTNKGGGSNVSGADMFYSIDGGAFQDATLAFNHDSVNGVGGDQRWYSDTAAGLDLLSGASLGTHTLAVYFRDSNTDRGHDFVSRNGANYNATFTVVPEPGSIAMMMGSGMFGIFYLIKRRRS